MLIATLILTGFLSIAGILFVIKCLKDDRVFHKKLEADKDQNQQVFFLDGEYLPGRYDEVLNCEQPYVELY